jgi:hypothetical protein
MTNFYKHKMITSCQYFLYKTFGEGFNKETLLRIVKKILAEPTRRFLHSSVNLSAPFTCNKVEQTLSTQLYSTRLTHQEERKRLQKLCKAIWLMGSLHLQGVLLIVHPYIQFI